MKAADDVGAAAECDAESDAAGVSATGIGDCDSGDAIFDEPGDDDADGDIVLASYDGGVAAAAHDGEHDDDADAGVDGDDADADIDDDGGENDGDDVSARSCATVVVVVDAADDCRC